MKKDSTTRFKLDPAHLPRLSKAQAARLDAMTEAEVEAAALADPDAQPLSEEQLAGFKRMPDIRAIRKKLRLTQQQFAATFHLSLAAVRDWEQARYQPDQAARTLLRVIAKDPEAVKRALRTS